MSNQTDQKNMVKLFVILKQVCDYITNVTTGKNAIKLHLFYSSFFISIYYSNSSMFHLKEKFQRGIYQLNISKSKRWH